MKARSEKFGSVEVANIVSPIDEKGPYDSPEQRRLSPPPSRVTHNRKDLSNVRAFYDGGNALDRTMREECANLSRRLRTLPSVFAANFHAPFRWR
ncbi:hypothetical protein [Paramesorhizobium deserti]|uniref:hypothetical protein n=1 Tax=Paramesorhizobium deserti TaxID=1494590 RepID=UPI0012905A7D|nr:hypothetical protein [Paramesorhizobium deserti]